MKRIVLVLLAVVFALPLFAADGFIGGPVRVESLGGQVIVVPDISTSGDLYSLGFSSGIFSRPAKSFISLIPTIDWNVYDLRLENMPMYLIDRGDSFGASVSGAKAEYEGAQIWLSKESVLVVKPQFANTWGAKEFEIAMAPGVVLGYGTEKPLLGGAIEYSHKVGGVALSAYLGSFSSGKTIKMKIDDVSIADAEMSFMQAVNKTDFALSAATDISGVKGLSVGVNVGNRKSALPAPALLTEPQIEGFAFMFMMMGMPGNSEYMVLNMLNDYSIKSEDIDYDANTKGENISDVKAEGMNVEIGAALKGDGTDVISGKIGATLGIRATRSELYRSYQLSTGIVTSETKDNYILAEDGFGLNAVLNLRKELGPVIAGLKASIDNVWAKEGYTAGRLDTSLYSISAGAAFSAGGMLIPFEVFLNGVDNTESIFKEVELTRLYEAGVRVGGELMLGGLALRLGTDYAAGSYYSKTTDDGEVTSESDAAGSQDNPYRMNLGLNMGLGLKVGGMEVNLNARYNPFWSQHKDDDVTKDWNNDISLKADVRIYI